MAPIPSAGHGVAPAITRTPGRVSNVGLWVLQAVLAFQFAGGGIMKVTGAPVMVDMFAEIGASQWLRYVVGVLEVAGAVGLLIPLVSSLAALRLAASSASLSASMRRRTGSVGGQGNRPGGGGTPRAGAGAQAASGSRPWCRRHGGTARGLTASWPTRLEEAQRHLEQGLVETRWR